MATELIPGDYSAWLESVKSRIQSARSRAALAVNAELIQLYHSIGGDILERQTRHGWGSKIIARVAADLKAAFPDMKGFSTRNLHYMRLFAEQCPEMRFVQQAAAQLPWFHIVTLLTQAEPTGKTPSRRQSQAADHTWDIKTSTRHRSRLEGNGLAQRRGAAEKKKNSERSAPPRLCANIPAFMVLQFRHPYRLTLQRFRLLSEH